MPVEIDIFGRARALSNNVIGASNPDYHNIHNSNKWRKWRCRGFTDYPGGYILSRIHTAPEQLTGSGLGIEE